MPGLGLLALTGNLSRADGAGSAGSPRKGQIISAFYSSAITPIVVTCTGGGIGGCPATVTYIQSDVTLVQTTTDHLGNFSFSLPANTNTVTIYAADYVVGTPLTSPDACGCPVLYTTTYMINPADLDQSSGGSSGGFVRTGSSPTYTSSQWTGANRGVTLNGVFDATIGNYDPILTPAVCNFSVGANDLAVLRSVQVLVKKGSTYYAVNNATLTVTDSYGDSYTFSVVPGTGGLANYSTAGTTTDWVYWTGMVVNAGMPPDCSYATNPNLSVTTQDAFDFSTSGTALPAPTGFDWYADFRWQVILQDCTSPPPDTTVWNMRDYTDRQIIFRPQGGPMHVSIYNDHDTSPLSAAVGGTNTSHPAFALNGDAIDGTYLDGTNPYWARSRTHSRTWHTMTIPFPSLWTAGYVALTSAQHKGRLVVLGYHDNDPTNSHDPASGWYCTVGNLQPDGSYVWSTVPNPIGITVSANSGHLYVRPDSVLEFAYLDGGSAEHVVRCRVLALDGTGTWA